MRFNKQKCAQLLEIHEGRRRFLYKDTATPPKWTIGVGFNVEDTGLYDNEIDFILNNRIDMMYNEVLNLPGFRDLSCIRQIVIVDMAFNLGISRLKGFRKMWAAIAMRDYKLAANEMLDSRWADQVGSRATRLAYMMRTDEWPENL